MSFHDAFLDYQKLKYTKLASVMTMTITITITDTMIAPHYFSSMFLSQDSASSPAMYLL